MIKILYKKVLNARYLYLFHNDTKITHKMVLPTNRKKHLWLKIVSKSISFKYQEPDAYFFEKGQLDHRLGRYFYQR